MPTPTIAPRLPLGAAADTNDPRAYYRRGRELLEASPDSAAIAFLWAARLDPAWAAPLHARRVALLLADRRLLYQQSTLDVKGRPKRSPAALDSLRLRACSLDPVVPDGLDSLLVRAAAALVRRPSERVPTAEAPQPLDPELYERLFGNYAVIPPELGEVQGPPATGNRFHVGTGTTVQSLAAAMRRWDRRESGPCSPLAPRDAESEYLLGLIALERGVRDTAEWRLTRAIAEDATFWPAHRRLGLLRLDAGDTANAVAHLARASVLDPSDGGLAYLHGIALVAARRYSEAIDAFGRAIETAPEYAPPYAARARLLESAGELHQALTLYRAYLSRARHGDAERVQVRERLRALREELGEPEVPGDSA